MKFKKNILSYATFFVFSIYSFGPFFQGNAKTKNGDQPMFVYKDLLGFNQSYSCIQVELLMGPLVWMTKVLCMNICCFLLLKKAELPAVVTVGGALSILGANGLQFYEMQRFQNQAGPWLKALKEKESEIEPCSSKNV